MFCNQPYFSDLTILVSDYRDLQPILHQSQKTFHCAAIPPTQLVDCSRLYLHKRRPASLEFQSLKSHQRSWWIVQALPTQAPPSFARIPISQIPPTQLVDRSGATYTSGALLRSNSYLSNPTNAVGGSFRLYLQERPRHQLQSPKSHQRSWWIVQALPTQAPPCFARIPISQIHQRSWWIVQALPAQALPPPAPIFQFPKSHQHSWWDFGDVIRSRRRAGRSCR
jgi:hypothetical protein